MFLAGLLVWHNKDARADAIDAPRSVGDRYNALNRPGGALIEGWNVRPSLSLRGGYDDNVTLSRGGGPSSSEMQLRGSLEAERGTGPYTLQVRGALDQTWYPDSPRNDVTAVEFRAAAVMDLKPQWQLRGAVSYLQGVEDGVDNGIFVDGIFEPYARRAQYRRIPFEFGLDREIGAVALQLQAQVTSIDFDAQTTQAGLSVPQDFRSGWENDLRWRTVYAVLPQASVFGEAGASWHRYEDSQGDRDAWRVAVGGTVELTRLLVGEASVGYGQQSVPDAGETSGITYGARLHWFANELVSLTLNAERGFDVEVVTTGAGVTSAVPLTRDAVSLRAEWEPLRPLLVYAEAGYEQERKSRGRTDDFTSVIAGATYVLTSSLRLVVDGSYEFGTSDLSADVERRRISLGLTAVY